MYEYNRIDVLSFIFQTKNKIIYKAYFKPSPYFFNDESLPYSKDCYEFVIEMDSSLEDKPLYFDSNIGSTISHILSVFYKEKKDTVSIYICDSSNNRQDSRFKKFNHWFYHYNDGSLIKYDGFIKDRQGIVYPISVILNSHNPYVAEIFVKFNEITKSHSK